MADVIIWLIALVRVMGGERAAREIKIPNRSDMLGAWCLPLMSAACAEDERRYEDLQRKRNHAKISEDIMDLAKKMGAKVTVNG